MTYYAHSRATRQARWAIILTPLRRVTTFKMYLFFIYFFYIFAIKYFHIYTVGVVEVEMQKLRELRHRRVLTLHELGERSGVAYNTIWRLENGKSGAQPRTIRKLAAALGVEPEELVRVGGRDA